MSKEVGEVHLTNCRVLAQVADEMLETEGALLSV